MSFPLSSFPIILNFTESFFAISVSGCFPRYLICVSFPRLDEHTCSMIATLIPHGDLWPSIFWFVFTAFLLASRRWRTQSINVVQRRLIRLTLCIGFRFGDVCGVSQFSMFFLFASLFSIASFHSLLHVVMRKKSWLP